MNELILSIFPGVDLLGRGFEQEGFCVVRGPDAVWGGDVREFHPPRGKFAGVIGGPPCQNITCLNPARDLEKGLAMLREFCRCVSEAAPAWFLMENTPNVPRIAVDGYTVQRFTLNAAECGGRQHRNRVFQFGSRDGVAVVCDRQVTPRGVKLERTCLASEGARESHQTWFRKSRRRTWPEFCALQGLPAGYELPGMSVSARYRAVGNGVPVYVAATIARAIRSRGRFRGVTLCACGCGRGVTGAQRAATPSCRKRLQRARENADLFFGP